MLSAAPEETKLFEVKTSPITVLTPLFKIGLRILDNMVETTLYKIIFCSDYWKESKEEFPKIWICIYRHSLEDVYVP